MHPLTFLGLVKVSSTSNSTIVFSLVKLIAAGCELVQMNKNENVALHTCHRASGCYGNLNEDLTSTQADSQNCISLSYTLFQICIVIAQDQFTLSGNLRLNLQTVHNLVFVGPRSDNKTGGIVDVFDFTDFVFQADNGTVSTTGSTSSTTGAADSTSDNSSDHTGLIVGVVIGGAVFLIIVVVIIVVLIKRRN